MKVQRLLGQDDDWGPENFSKGLERRSVTTSHSDSQEGVLVQKIPKAAEQGSLRGASGELLTITAPRAILIDHCSRHMSPSASVGMVTVPEKQRTRSLRSLGFLGFLSQ